LHSRQYGAPRLKVFKDLKICTVHRDRYYIVQHGLGQTTMEIPYILESNPHPFYSFRGLKNQMRIRILCGLDSRSWAGFWKKW